MTDDVKQEETVEQKPKASKKGSVPKLPEPKVTPQELPDNLYQTLKAIWEPSDMPQTPFYSGAGGRALFEVVSAVVSVVISVNFLCSVSDVYRVIIRMLSANSELHGERSKS